MSKQSFPCGWPIHRWHKHQGQPGPLDLPLQTGELYILILANFTHHIHRNLCGVELQHQCIVKLVPKPTKAQFKLFWEQLPLHNRQVHNSMYLIVQYTNSSLFFSLGLTYWQVASNWLLECKRLHLQKVRLVCVKSRLSLWSNQVYSIPLYYL
jgi:hypothetical protein